MRISALLLAAFAAPACASGLADEPTHLAVTFETGAEAGAVLVSLFDSAAAYSGGAPLRQAKVDVAAGERTAVFTGLTPGTYAVKVFHDIDGNGRMTLNPFGRPIEPFAFSNNARGNMGPAEWESARFVLRGKTAQKIEVR